MNLELLASSVAGITTASSTSSVIATNANNFRVGDQLGFYDASATTLRNTTGAQITAKATNRTLTFDASVDAVLEATPTTSDGLFTYSRAGLTSIDDIVSIDATNVLDGTVETYANAYDLTATLAASGRTVADNPWKTAASVQANDGTGRDLSLNLLDTAIQKIRTNGGEPKLIVMGHDQYFKLERLLNSQQRYLGQEEYTVGVGSEKTFPGTRTGLILATYMGIPILPDADTTKSAKIGSTGGTHGSNVYVLDTDYLEVAVAQPTQYIENRDYFAASSLVVRGLLYTMAELRAHRFDVQAKIVDLNE
jgi:hypothetical protein